MCTKISLRNCPGFTVVEVVAAGAIGCILMLAVVSLTVYSGRIMAGIYNYVDLDYTSRLGLDNMTREIRQAKGLKDLQTNKLVLVDFDDADLTYEYLPTEKTLARKKGETQQTILSGCDWLQFSIFKQNPIQGSFDLNLSTNTSNCKVVSMSWSCSRSLLGRKLNTESIQQAKIVIRKNQHAYPFY